jgi:hypothetical protein
MACVSVHLGAPRARKRSGVLAGPLHAGIVQVIEDRQVLVIQQSDHGLLISHFYRTAFAVHPNHWPSNFLCEVDNFRRSTLSARGLPIPHGEQQLGLVYSGSAAIVELFMAITALGGYFHRRGPREHIFRARPRIRIEVQPELLAWHREQNTQRNS